jgi:hypothetical protein
MATFATGAAEPADRDPAVAATARQRRPTKAGPACHVKGARDLAPQHEGQRHSTKVSMVQAGRTA